MTNGEIIEQLENAIGLIKQDGKDWLDDRDIPILEACIKSLTALDKYKAETPQEPQTFKWCTDCREYDQEKHCCHRWSKVIRDTVEEMKQEYIEREVLDKIRAEILQVVVEESAEDPRWALGLKYSIKIIDKYKAETEDT